MRGWWPGSGHDRGAPRLTELRSIRIGDEPGAWERAGFAVSGGITRVGTVVLELAGAQTRRGILDWVLSGVDEPVDGLPVGPAAPGPAAPGSGADASEPTPHPNGARLIDHVVIASPDLDRTAGAFAAVGSAPRAERTTEAYGAPMRQVFCRAGEVILELVGGSEPDPDPDRRARPARWFGLAITVDDLDGLAASMGDGLGRVKDAVQPGRRIATLRHASFGLSVPIAFMTPPPR